MNEVSLVPTGAVNVPVMVKSPSILRVFEAESEFVKVVLLETVTLPSTEMLGSQVVASTTTPVFVFNYLSR
ncbi:MAG: hypothetical protein UV44_C0027G0005 [candidate division WWE3 bacterium GW2011_GWD1_42_70]|nr:MAG: hypothetical protein UV44_C0027G0005 [candidate division WWE3 bacterium GW2011_GWD1_42_70]